jgi:hypothetical protein
VAAEHHAEQRQAFLVEHYRPGRQVEELTLAFAVVRAAVVDMERAGLPITYVRTTIVPKDEAFLCVIEAASAELIGDAYARAGIAFDRISPAISPEDERGARP